MNKLILFTLVFLFSTFSIAEPNINKLAGTELKLAVDWERIEKGLITGDFSCSGNCLNVSIDWKEAFYILSGQKYMDAQKSNIAYCSAQYLSISKSIDNVELMLIEGKITEKQSRLLLKIKSNSLEAVSISCADSLGKRKNTNLKSEIMN